MVSTCAAARFWFGQIGRVAVDMQDHVAGTVAEFGVGIGGTIVEEMDHLDGGGFRSNGLGGRQVAEDVEHGGVDGPRIIEELSHDTLEEFGVLGRVLGGSIKRACKLDFGAVLGG